MLTEFEAEPSSGALHYINSTTMDLFALPVEVRLIIYSQLLVHPAPINLNRQGYISLRLRLQERMGFCPALLRTCKQIYHEAVSLLYSDNCFHFLGGAAGWMGYETLALFLGQIGLQARLLRYVCVPFSDLSLRLYECHLKDLDRIRDACVGITTLKLSSHFTPGHPVSAAALDLIDTRLKAIPSLQNVIVDLRWYGKESVNASDDEAGDPGSVDDWNHPGGRLATMLRERGWTVQVTKLVAIKVHADCEDKFKFS